MKASFIECQDLLVALGDENRQNILLALADKSCIEGLRVGEITKKVNLSRPAVSHHLKILRETNLVNVRQEGTMNFYSADLKTDLKKLTNLIQAIKNLGVED
ncbi:metalloregulator ArsR/SmtB family transcription factor [Companilactobacillus musae]|uniref:ArsR/SmtB family transcription factor n=1 Tax=Companilactobacillus musae TaxID=1903258 RepID=UPI000E6477FD|nr:metalloregulator ArsR/SmtB family transcription factor [Companilactobacillus musae]